MAPEGSVPCPQQPASGSYPEPDESIPHLPTQRLYGKMYEGTSLTVH
jgi:hypothetical protein